ncbi:MAG: hypothetical protein LBF60_07255 [Treponema sp.]|jgi:predicted membrane-bound spermidine synthase|nr:hypothetical protein [Treponema sp.]
MERFWNIFWKIFGAVILIALVVSLIGGIVMHSASFTYTLIQQTFAVALGVSGIIGFLIVPLEMYLEDRNQRKKDNVLM